MSPRKLQDEEGQREDQAKRLKDMVRQYFSRRDPKDKKNWKNSELT